MPMSIPSWEDRGQTVCGCVGSRQPVGLFSLEFRRFMNSTLHRGFIWQTQSDCVCRLKCAAQILRIISRYTMWSKVCGHLFFSPITKKVQILIMATLTMSYQTASGNNMDTKPKCVRSFMTRMLQKWLYCSRKRFHNNHMGAVLQCAQTFSWDWNETFHKPENRKRVC